MSEDDSLVEEFFSEVNDKYYPQILEGIDLLDEQKIEEGIDVLSRPLHTIKGVTGFMSGFEPASEFTHKVESFLKKMQSGEVDHKLPQIALAIESVNSIFMLIEQLRESGCYDRDTIQDIEIRLSGEGQTAKGEGHGTSVPIEMESLDEAEVITLKSKRIYNPAQLEAVRTALENLEEGRPVLFDFEAAISVGSSFFELISAYADIREIGICGMNNHCTSTFYSWGFQNLIMVVDNRDSFFN